MGNRSGKKKGDSASKGALKYRREMKLVVLGIAASGKSTFTRQMRLIHESPWTEGELTAFNSIILSNIYDAIKEVCAELRKTEEALQDENNNKRARYFYELGDTPALNDEQVKRISELVSDGTFQNVMAQLGDSSVMVRNLAYFFPRLDVIAADNYVPSDDDILHCRQRSTGATDTCFVKDKTKFTLVDMGGQRCERLKWDQLLKDKTVKGVFYFVSIEEFNVESTEEPGKTKLQQSLEVWAEALEIPSMSTVSIMLLFNKMDLFQAKLGKDFSCFSDQFPDYAGPKTQDGAVAHVRDMFVKVIPAHIKPDYVSSFVCCGLDTSLMGNLFEEAKQHLLSRAMNSL